MNPADNRYGVAVLLETGTGIPKGWVMQYNVGREFIASEWTKVRSMVFLYIEGYLCPAPIYPRQIMCTGHVPE